MIRCVDPDEEIAPGGRTMAAGCPTWIGLNICETDDVNAWRSALYEKMQEIDDLLIVQAPGTGDQERIIALREAVDQAEKSGVGSPKGKVMAWARAVDLAYCVIRNWEGRGESLPVENKPKKPKEPNKEDPSPKNGDPSALTLAAAAFVSGAIVYAVRR